jgi:hypothetical protein
MKAWALHALFAIILVGSLVVKERSDDVLVERGNLELAVIRVARSYGLIFRGYTTISDAEIRALLFDAQGCRVSVVLFPVTFEQEPVVRSIRGHPDVRRRYAYLDAAWDKPHRLAVFFLRTRVAALAAFGLTRYVPSWHMLVVDSPTDCQVQEAIDWRTVWNRDYLTATPADTANQTN